MSFNDTADNTGEDGTGVEPVIEQKSRWEDYIDVFFSPTDLFRRRGRDKVAPPLITLCILTLIFYYILLPAQKIISAASMALMPPEMQAKMTGVSDIMALAGGIVVPITTLIGVAITAAILWALARLVDAKPEFREMMIVATYAGYIALLGFIAKYVMVMVHGAEGFDMMKHTSLGILRFVDVKSMPSFLPALLARFDIFTIWQAVIWAIGFQVVTGVSRSKAAMVAGGAWLLYAVPGMLGGGAMGKLGSVEVKQNQP